jgi:hypothetical protein
MAKKPKREPKSLRNYLILSFVAAAFVGILVYGGVQDTARAFTWAAITFIVVLVGISTLALMVKDEDNDPDKPKLS